MAKTTKYNDIQPNKKQPEQREDDISVSGKKDKKVLDYEPQVHKKKGFDAFKDTMFGEAGVTSIAGALVRDIVVPSIKNVIVDSVSSGINMLIFGDNRGIRTGSRPTYNRGSYTNYAGQYSSTTKPVNNARSDIRSSNRINEYVLRTRDEALEILDNLIAFSNQYGYATVADYYDLIGVDTKYTDNSFGWTEEDLRHATLNPVSNGYIINLPKPVTV